jgi:hypothetical protein
MKTDRLMEVAIKCLLDRLCTLSLEEKVIAVTSQIKKKSNIYCQQTKFPT